MMLRIIGPFGFISHTQEHKGAGNAGLIPGKIFGRHDGICAFDALRSRCMLDGCDSLCGEGFVIDDSRSAIQIGKRNFRTHAVGDSFCNFFHSSFDIVQQIFAVGPDSGYYRNFFRDDVIGGTLHIDSTNREHCSVCRRDFPADDGLPCGYDLAGCDHRIDAVLGKRAMSADPFTLLHDSGYGAAASGLCNIFFFPGHKTYGPSNRFFGNGDEIICIIFQHLVAECPDPADEGITDRAFTGIIFIKYPVFIGFDHGRTGFRLHSDDLDIRFDRFCGDRDSGDEGTAPDRHDHSIDVRILFQDFDADGSLTAVNLRVIVVGINVGHAVDVDVVHAEGMGFVIIVPHEKHLCTEVTDLVQLAFRRCPGNNDLCVWNPKKRCGIADRASVVPGRDGRNTAGQFLRCQGQKLIIK